MKTTGVFIDIARQYNSITKMNKDVRINYKKLLEELSKDNEIHRVYCYGVQINNESESFIKVLKYLGFNTKYKYAKFVDNRPNIYETSWALGMTLDIVRNIDHLNKVIIGSNDFDLLESIEWIKEQGVLVEICGRSIHRDIRNLADKCYDIPACALQISESKSDNSKEQKSVELPAN